MELRSYQQQDIPQMTLIWNEIIEDGMAFPGEELYTPEGMKAFLEEQTAVVCAAEDDRILGFYILHPNNIGRCGHIANASYAVASGMRGKGIGEKLVQNCLEMTGACGFTGLQFNAVVENNLGAIHLYQKLGFILVGKIPNGFRIKDGSFQNILIFYHDACPPPQQEGNPL